MPRLRCSCGKLTTTRKLACASCGNSQHLVHCHHPRETLEKDHWKTCADALAHAHTYDAGDHEHSA